MLAPPPYTPSMAPSSAPHTSPLLALPQHLLLAIISHMDLPILALSLRLVCRPLYITCMASLRHRLLPSWKARVRSRGYTTAAGRETGLTVAEGDVMQHRTRETAVLDLYIAASALEQLRGSESTLLLPEGEDEAGLPVQDIFDFLQPRARVEDLVMKYGKVDKILYSDDLSAELSQAGIEGGGTILATDVTVHLSPREAKLFLPFLSSNGSSADSRQVRTVTRSVVEVSRVDKERLEVTADNLVRALRNVRVWREERGGRGWYERG